MLSDASIVGLTLVGIVYSWDKFAKLPWKLVNLPRPNQIDA
jgi:hypothetical protein